MLKYESHLKTGAKNVISDDNELIKEEVEGKENYRMDDKVQLFENKKNRTDWNEAEEQWYFSVVDAIAVLTESKNPQTYWRVLKKRLIDEGNESVTNCNALKMTAADGKMRKTDVANTEQILRVIQSIPSPKAEPFKAWLARVGAERIDETIDPELTIDRALATYLDKGYNREWINQRFICFLRGL